MIEEKLHHKFRHIYEVVSSDKFLSMEALGGEIPFWISAYNPKQENEVNLEIKNLQKKLQNQGVEALLVNLLELSIQIIEDQEFTSLDAMYSVEKKKTKEKFKKALQSTINIHERFIPSIKKQVEDKNPDLLMITGVGSVFPFIRSHTILNNLQSNVKDIPTLMFFPGKYTGQSLELFGRLKDDNYYRAFNMDNYKL